MHTACHGKALLVGIGSPFGEDRLGWQAVDALQAGAWASRHPAWEWQITVLDRPGTSLLDSLDGIELAIIIDALQADGSEPRLLDIDELASESAPLSGHGLGLAESLQLGRQLELLPKQLLLVGLPMGRVLDVPGLSEWLDQQLKKIG